MFWRTPVIAGAMFWRAPVMAGARFTDGGADGVVRMTGAERIGGADRGIEGPIEGETDVPLPSAARGITGDGAARW